MATPSLLDSVTLEPQVRSFFHAIKENPDDDTPRLIFADWLQEHGNAADAARGEFLRLSVLRHRLSPEDPTYGLLKRREGELFTEHRWTWLGPLADAAIAWTFERGMIRITARADKLTSPEVTAWSQTPAAFWVDTLMLRNVVPLPSTDVLDKLGQSPLLAEINYLKLRSWPPAEALFTLERAARAKSLRFLTKLCLASCRLRRVEIIELTRSIELPSLKVLDLQHNRLGDTAVRMLAESSSLRNLSELRLGHNRFSAEGMARLRRAFGERVRF